MICFLVMIWNSLWFYSFSFSNFRIKIKITFTPFLLGMLVLMNKVCELSYSHVVKAHVFVMVKVWSHKMGSKSNLRLYPFSSQSLKLEWISCSLPNWRFSFFLNYLHQRMDLSSSPNLKHVVKSFSCTYHFGVHLKSTLNHTPLTLYLWISWYVKLYNCDPFPRSKSKKSS